MLWSVTETADDSVVLLGWIYMGMIASRYWEFESFYEPVEQQCYFDTRIDKQCWYVDYPLDYVLLAKDDFKWYVKASALCLF